MASRVWMVTATLALAGCMTEPPRLCDGSTDVRLAATTFDYFLGSPLRSQNGMSFLYVEGSCQFFVQTEGEFAPTRSGTLDAADEAFVSEVLGYADWSSFAGSYVSGVQDASVLTLRREGADAVRVTCDGCSLAPSTPAALAELQRRLPSLLGTLWARGSDLSGSVRFVVLADGASGGGASWPLPEFDLSELATKGWLPPGTVTDTPAQATALRALRAYAVGSQLHVYDLSGAQYRVVLRDVLPIEDSLGNVLPR